jgi:tetratricopeptide (TPR) repeat protein
LGAALRCARAQLWSQLGRSDEALATLTREIAANNPDDALASQCLMARASLALNSGDADGALQFAQTALRRFEMAGVDTIYGRSEILQSIGAAYGLRDEFGLAHANYREALRILTAAGRARGRAAANVHDDWSSVWMNAGNPRRALEETDTGWGIVRELAPNAQISDVRIYRRARILTQLGRFEEALAEFKLAHRLATSRGNTLSIGGVLIGEADVAIAQGRLDTAAELLDTAAASLREARLPEHHLLATRYLMVLAALSQAQDRGAEARALLTRVIESYAAQDCCRANSALALSLRGESALRDGDLAAAAADAAHAREFAPALEHESFSRFTGRAWYLWGLIYEQQRQWRTARDAFAIAAVQFAGSLGEGHPDTLRARDASAHASNQVAE